MKPKQILTAVLLTFVAVSLIAVVLKGKGSSSSSVNKAALLQGDKTIVYYFHGNKRCKTCNNMERYTKLALDRNYGKELQDGSVVLSAVNLDQSGNEHYVSDYDMEFRVVVLSKIVDGKEAKWKRLDDVWDLAGDEEAYIKYISEGLAAIMKEDI